MSSLDQFKLLSQYNQWMNKKIYTLCDTLSDKERKEDVGAFFKSIHGTLDHIVVADIAWLERLRDNQFTPRSLNTFMFESWGELTSKRQSLDNNIQDWLDSLNEQSILQTFDFTSNIDKITRSKPYWSLIMHMFNHQTHHRGQITTLLSQRNLDIGSTDIPFMPEQGK